MLESSQTACLITRALAAAAAAAANRVKRSTESPFEVKTSGSYASKPLSYALPSKEVVMFPFKSDAGSKLEHGNPAN